jgi:class 3 adenylate cyclase/tetratricopeptide (TPR) repeat protein
MTTEARPARGLRPYVPRFLSSWSPTHGDPRHMRVTGTLAFVDISGFTKLTERLARKGRRGAEEMSDLLNSTFAALLVVARDEGADLLKWGGDAVLLLFRGEEHATRAVRATVDMRTALRTAGRLQTSEGSVTLRMSVGVHSGDFDCYLVGDPDVHRELLVVGPGVTTTAEMEQAACAGEVVVSPQTAALLPAGSHRERTADDARLVHSRRALGPGGRSRREDSGPTLTDQELAGFLPPVIRRQLIAEPGEAEHRNVAVAFVRFSGTDGLTATQGVRAVADALDQCVRTVQRATQDNGVTFFETDLDRDGGKVMLVAGAPRSYGHDEERMLRTARQVMDGAGILPLRIGINRGNVFAGGFGPEFRRTFSVKGDAVNLAARVMGQAVDGEVLATAAALERSATLFDTEPLPPFQVKGKAQPVQASRVGALRGERREARGATPFVGREHELSVLRGALEGARAGAGSQIEVVGEPGIGKSRLVDQLLADAAADGVSLTLATATCGEYESTTAYYPFRQLLREVLGLGRDDDPGTVTRRLVDVVEATAPHLTVWLPLLGIPLGLDLPGTRESSEVDEQFRKGRLEEVVAELLAALLATPAVLVVEDTHLMDDASADLVQRLVRDVATRPWLLVVTRRELAKGYAPAPGPQLSTVRPAPLDPAAALALVQAAVRDRPLSKDGLAALAARGGGNPMFLEALSSAAGRDSTVEDLPESVEDLVTSEIDRLDPVDRTVLRYAAVLGFVVHKDDLQTLLTAQLGAGSESDLGERLPRLEEFLTRTSPGRLRFRHALLRDVAYEGLPFRRRQVLHDQVGARLEMSSADPQEHSELLSLHYFQAGQYEKAWRYSRIAGSRARSIFANAEAAIFLGRAVDAARKTGGVPAHELAEVLDSLGDTRFLMGSATEAAAAYSQARRLIADDHSRVAQIMLKEARIEQRQGKFALSLRRLSRGLGLLRDLEGSQAAAARSLLANRYAICRISQGRYRDALRWGEIAVREAQDSTDMVALAQAYLAMQTIHSWSGVPEDLPYGKLALNAYEDLGDLAGQAQSLNNLAVHAVFEGRWTESIAMFHRAADNFQRLGDIVQVGNTNYNEADVLIRQGRLAEVEPLLQDALVAARAGGDEELVALVIREQGKAWSRGGRFEEGLASLADAKERFADLGAPPEIVDADAAVAECLMLQGRLEDAVEKATSTMARAVEVSARMVLPTLHRILGFCHLHAGRLHEARIALDAGLQLCSDPDMRHEHGYITLGLAQLAVAEGDPCATDLMLESSGTLQRLGVVAAPIPGATVVDIRIPEQTRADITLHA